MLRINRHRILNVVLLFTAKIYQGLVCNATHGWYGRWLGCYWYLSKYWTTTVPHTQTKRILCPDVSKLHKNQVPTQSDDQGRGRAREWFNCIRNASTKISPTWRWRLLTLILTYANMCRKIYAPITVINLSNYVNTTRGLVKRYSALYDTDQNATTYTSDTAAMHVGNVKKSMSVWHSSSHRALPDFNEVSSVTGPEVPWKKLNLAR